MSFHLPFQAKYHGTGDLNSKKKKPATGYGVNSVTFGDEVLKNRSRAGNLDGILPGKLLKNKKTQTGEYNDGCVKTS